MWPKNKSLIPTLYSLPVPGGCQEVTKIVENTVIYSFIYCFIYVVVVCVTAWMLAKTDLFYFKPYRGVPIE